MKVNDSLNSGVLAVENIQKMLKELENVPQARYSIANIDMEDGRKYEVFLYADGMYMYNYQDNTKTKWLDAEEIKNGLTEESVFGKKD